jgi:hypothetical protein
MGLHQGAPRLKPPSFHYPGGDESQGWRPVTEYEPLHKKDHDEHVLRFQRYVLTNVNHRLLNATTHLRTSDQWLGPMHGYMKAYGEVVWCLTLEPSPNGGANTDALTEVFWDLKGIRSAMESTEPTGRVLRLISDLRTSMENL